MNRNDGSVLKQIGSVYGGESVGGLDDNALLSRFVTRGDEVAFSALVQRHGPMILRVCRTALRDPAEVDDAFQAVFVVLARKASRLRIVGTVGPWLHAVALRTTASSRRAAARRRAVERGAAVRIVAVEPLRDRDLARVVHEEIERLPASYREVVVLCDLEGVSHEEAASRLGCPLGTVKSRQSRGRTCLRDRLARRGLDSAGALLALPALPSPVPISLVSVTTRISIGALAQTGTGVVPAAVTALALDVGRRLAMKRFVSLAALALATLAGVATGATLVMRTPEPRSNEAPPASFDPVAYLEAETIVQRTPRGSLLALRIAADTSHDFEAVRRAREADGLRSPPEGFAWVRVDRVGDESTDGLIVRKEDSGPDQGAEYLLVKVNPDDITEHDVIRGRKEKDQHDHDAIWFQLTHDGARRLRAITTAHRPENDGMFKYRLALIVHGAVGFAPMLNVPLNDGGLIYLDPTKGADQADRLLNDFRPFFVVNQGPPRTRSASTREDAIRQALADDLPPLQAASRVAIEVDGERSGVFLADPIVLNKLRAMLKPGANLTGEGSTEVTMEFLRGEESIRRIWVKSGGEWGFERRGRNWTIGREPKLWDLVRSYIKK